MDTKCLSCYDVEKNFGKNLQYLKKASNNPKCLDYHLYKILTKYEEEDIKCFVKLLSLEKHKKILDLYLKRIKTHLIDFEFLNKDLLDLYKRLILINSNIGEALAFIINNYDLNNSKHIRLVYDFLLDLSKYSRESFITYWVNLTGYKEDVIDFIKYNKITTQDARVLELLDKRVPIKAIQHFVDDCALISTTEADYNYKIKLILGNIKDYKEKTNSIYAKKEIEGIYKEMFIFYNIIKGNFNYFIEDKEIKKLAEENAIKDKQVIYRILYNAFGFRDYTKKLDKTNAKKFLVLSDIFHIHFVKGFGKLKEIDRQILRKNFEISNTRTCLDFFEFEFLNIRYWYPDYSEFKFDLEETFNEIYAKSKPKVTAKDRFKNRKEKLNKIENNDIFSRLDKLENAPSRQID